MTNRAVGEITVQEWKGDAVEKALVMIHPERFKSPEQVALSLLLLVGDEVHGSRRHSGALSLGVELNKETGALGYVPGEVGVHAKSVLKSILNSVGEMPLGYVVLPEPKVAAPSRMRKYACGTCGQIVRGASESLQIACLHANTEHFGEPAAMFVFVPKAVKAEKVVKVRTPRARKTNGSAAAETAAPVTQRENIANLSALVAAGAAKVAGAAPRAFGQ